MDYELRHFRSNTDENPNRTKTVRVFHKKAPIKCIRSYPRSMLKDVIKHGIPGTPFEYCQTTVHLPSQDWKRRVLYPDEIDSQFEIGLVVEELGIHSEGLRWVKICLYHPETDTFYLRSISNQRDHKDYKILDLSKDDEWFIDNATLSADHSFWRLLAMLV
jgi:hypothetical protein